MEITLPFPRATRANVECNAPLSLVEYTVERGARQTQASDAAIQAQIEQQRAESAAEERRTQKQEFRRKVLQRLKCARSQQLSWQKKTVHLQMEQLRRLRLDFSAPANAAHQPSLDLKGEMAPDVRIDQGQPSVEGSTLSGSDASYHELPSISKMEEVRLRIEEKAAMARKLMLTSTGEHKIEGGHQEGREELSGERHDEHCLTEKHRREESEPVKAESESSDGAPYGPS